MKTSNGRTLVVLVGALLCIAVGAAMAHEQGDPGQPVCLEGNFMVADAQNTPFSSAGGPGRVLEMNIFTGGRGITVDVPFTAENVGTARSSPTTSRRRAPGNRPASCRPASSSPKKGCTSACSTVRRCSCLTGRPGCEPTASLDRDAWRSI